MPKNLTAEQKAQQRATFDGGLPLAWHLVMCSACTSADASAEQWRAIVEDEEGHLACGECGCYVRPRWPIREIGDGRGPHQAGGA